MHCPRPEYSPYQLTSHYQHCCTVTIPAARTHTNTYTHGLNHKFGLTRKKHTVCITLERGEKPGGRPAPPDKRLKLRHAWAHKLCRHCVFVCVSGREHACDLQQVKFRPSHLSVSSAVTFLLLEQQQQP